MKLPCRIAIVSQKGGVGKTTLALNLSLALAERNHSIVLMDTDPQGGVTNALARGDHNPGVADLLVKAIEPSLATLQTTVPTLRIVPRGRLDPADVCEYEEAIFSSGALDEVLKSVESDKTITIIDTPSGMGMITRAVLQNSDYVLIPTPTTPLVLRSIGQILRMIEVIGSTENPRLQLLGILLMMIDRNSKSSQQVLADLSVGFAGVLETVIPKSPVFDEASLKGIPVAFLGNPVEARRYRNLADEIESLLDHGTNQEGLHVTATRQLF